MMIGFATLVGWCVALFADLICMMDSKEEEKDIMTKRHCVAGQAKDEENP
jgi:hypothetical protein